MHPFIAELLIIAFATIVVGLTAFLIRVEYAEFFERWVNELIDERLDQREEIANRKAKKAEEGVQNPEKKLQ